MTPDLQKVVEGGYCIGCGGCAYAVGGQMTLDALGLYQPDFETVHPDRSTEKLDETCPFLAPHLDEDMLAAHFLAPSPHRDHALGQYHDVFAAHVEEDDFRARGSSGGMGSWLSVELLRQDLIDGVIHAAPVARQGATDPFFRYQISRSPEQIRRAAHSHYHVVEISDVLAEVKRTPGRYLFIGVPCLVKAVRRAQLSDKVLAERVIFTIGLICGHLKSVNWAVSLGWGAGVAPADIGAITFRVKSEDVPAKAYFFEVENKQTGQKTVHDSAQMTGGKFNLGAMMPDACNFCDDVVAETADLTIGDAWLPRYAFDWRGKNMIVSRNPVLGDLIRQATVDGRIKIDSMTVSEARDAQAGGLRQRREGLAFRLAQAAATGRWVPRKRSLPDMKAPGLVRRRIYTLRSAVARKSHVAFHNARQSRDLRHYERDMRGPFKRLRRLELSVAAFRILSVRVQAMLSRKSL